MYTGATAPEWSPDARWEMWKSWVAVFSPHLRQALGTNILAGVLDASNQVWHKLVDGALVLYSTGDPLCNFNFICFTENHREQSLRQLQSWGGSSYQLFPWNGGEGNPSSFPPPPGLIKTSKSMYWRYLSSTQAIQFLPKCQSACSIVVD